MPFIALLLFAISGLSCGSPTETILVPVWFEKEIPEFAIDRYSDSYESVIGLIQRHSILSDTSDVFLDTTGHPSIDSLVAQIQGFAWLQKYEEHLLWGLNIGISISTLNDSIIVTEFDRNSPAERAGVRVHDRIVRINGQEIGKLTPNEVSMMIASSSDSVVVLDIVRPGFGHGSYRMRRERFEKEAVTGFYLDGLQAGYVRVKHFSTAKDAIQSVVEGFLDQDIRYLIIDVRHNDGGYLDDVLESAKLFLRSNTVLTWQRFNRYTYNKLIKTFDDGEFISRDLQLIVLIDQWTSSGAELFAGILKEHAGAVLVGAPTAGSGHISKNFSLPESSLRLVVGSIYLPSGAPLEAAGLQPDSNILRYETEYRFSVPANYLDFYQLVDSSDVYMKTVVRIITSGHTP